MRSVTPNLSSGLTSSPFQYSLSDSAHISLLLQQPPAAELPPRRRSSSSSFLSPSNVCVANSCIERPLGLQSLRIVDQSPPWVVHPPHGGSSDHREMLFSLPARGSSVGSVPLSPLRAAQDEDDEPLRQVLAGDPGRPFAEPSLKVG